MDNDDYDFLFEDDPTPPPNRRKRSHAQMLQEDARIDSFFNRQQAPIPTQYPSSSSASLNRFFPPPPPPPPPQQQHYQVSRYVGDGMDFRRPAMAANTPTDNVIDLTGSDSPPGPRPSAARRTSRQRLQGPQPGQEVISLDDSDDETERQRPRQDPRRASDPDVELITERPLQRPTPPNPATQGVAWHAQHAQERVEPSHPFGLGVPLALGRMFAHSPFLQQLAHPLRRQEHAMHTIRARLRDPRTHRQHHHHHVNFVSPNLRYDHAAFPVAADLVQEQIYEAPPSAKEGFTRTPAKDDVLVCPNCDEELGEGATDVKKQIWVVRSCGHVYCGQCATNRHRSKRTNGDPSKTFTKCVIDGCMNKSVSSSKAMFQVYI